MEKLVKRNANIYSKEKGENLLLIDLEDSNSEVFELEGLAVDIWKELEEALTREELVEFLSENYTDPPKDLAGLIDEQLVELEKLKFIVVTDEQTE